MSVASDLRTLSRPLVEYRVILSIGLSAACGVMLDSLYPIEERNPFLQLVAIERPAIFHGLVWSYNVFLYSTPFLVFSILFSLAYIHFYEPRPDRLAGALPLYPHPRHRAELYLIAGEVHHPLKPAPSPAPRWLSIPERGLYTGICVVGAIGSGKTQAVILPAMRQLFAYKADDPVRRLSGIVLEVKGDLCRQARAILSSCGRADDYVEVSLTGNVRYNPLNNDADAYAQAYTHRGQVGFDDLLRAVLRHRPDRILVGEVRGAEARTLLDAMNTGHRGTLATIHARSCAQAIVRLAALANRVPGSPGIEATEREVRGSLDTVVFISRDGGRRHVREILSLVQSE